MAVIIRVNGLTKYYGNKKALDSISFNVSKGEVVGLLGLNGAGKSTTMNILAGCLALTDGKVFIGDIDISKEPLAAKHKVGYLPEQPPLYTDMKVKEFLIFVCGLKKLKLDYKKHVDEVCSLVRLTDVSGRIIRNLSKGYRQRVGLAQALLGNPEVLILDEPTVGLDPTQMAEIRSLIKELGKERTILFSSHILSEVQAVCKRIIVLNKGIIAADDYSEKLQNTVKNQSYTAVIEGAPEEVIPLLSEIDGMIAVTSMFNQNGIIWEYKLEFNEGKDIRKDVFIALSQKGLPLLSTKGTDLSLEEIFIKMINTPIEGGILLNR